MICVVVLIAFYLMNWLFVSFMFVLVCIGWFILAILCVALIDCFTLAMWLFSV